MEYKEHVGELHAEYLHCRCRVGAGLNMPTLPCDCPTEL